MSAMSLPAASLQRRFGSLHTRVGKRVSNPLCHKALLRTIRSISGLESILLPVFPVMQGSAEGLRLAHRGS